MYIFVILLVNCDCNLQKEITIMRSKLYRAPPYKMTQLAFNTTSFLYWGRPLFPEQLWIYTKVKLGIWEATQSIIMFYIFKIKFSPTFFRWFVTRFLNAKLIYFGIDKTSVVNGIFNFKRSPIETTLLMASWNLQIAKNT